MRMAVKPQQQQVVVLRSRECCGQGTRQGCMQPQRVLLVLLLLVVMLLKTSLTVLLRILGCRWTRRTAVRVALVVQTQRRCQIAPQAGRQQQGQGQRVLPRAAMPRSRSSGEH